MINTSKLIMSAMKNMEASLEKETTLTVLREIKTKESLLREPLTAEIQYNWLKKMAKEREESAETYAKAERIDLANKEFFELARIRDLMKFLEKELPKQLTKEEILAIIKNEKFASIKECMMYFSKIPGCDKKLVSEIFKSK